MASNTLLRSSILRGSALRRFLQSAAGAAPPSAPAEGLAARRAAPPRRFFSSGAPGEQQHPKSLDDKVCKVDHTLRQVQELNQLVEQNVFELLEQYKEYRTADHNCFERFVTTCGMEKSKFRDDFIWRCQYSTLLVLSAGVGYLLALRELYF